MSSIIVIVDYGMGNLRSVEKSFQRLGADVVISSDLDILRKADKLILPGVGHFANGVMKLKESGMWDILNNKVLVQKVPILGICLGMQLMAGHSEEGNIDGLGWFNANVVRFKIKDKLKYKVPHMGWNNLLIKKETPLLNNITNIAMFYFVHSYHIICNDDNDILAKTIYEYEFSSVIQKDNIFGTQFHPEKSHNSGEYIFKNFLKL